MSANVTPNLGLSQWEAADPVLREDFNRDNALLDAACAAIPKMAVGAYTGSGTFGPDQAVTEITFDFSPRLVVVSPDSTLNLHGALVLVRGQSAFNGTGFLTDSAGGLGLAVTWGEKSVSWRCANGGSAEKQFNEKNTAYRYFAIGEG